MNIFTTVRYHAVYVLLFCVLLGGCRKKEDPAPEPDPPTNTPDTVADPDCKSLPPPPSGFNWVDSTGDDEKNVIAFFYNPVNSEEVLLITRGNIQGANRLINYNLRTGTTIHLGNTGEFLPSINHKGWILFSDANANIIKIKVNGDSAAQLTNTQGAHDPRWDHTGNSFYYLQDAFSTVASRLIRASAKGVPFANDPHDLPGTVPFKKSDKILWLKSNQQQVTMLIRDNHSGLETPLIQAPALSKGLPFENLCIDNADEKIYWSNKAGIMRYELLTRKTDTLFKTCETVIYDNPMTGTAPSEINFSKLVITPKSPYFLIHNYQTIEYDVMLKQQRELKFFR